MMKQISETDEERRARIYPVILSEYNPAWPEWFVEEKANLNRLIKLNRHLRLKDLTDLLNMKLRGHYQYYGVTDNSRSINNFCFQTRRMLFKWLNRRSQKRSYNWDEFNELLKTFPLASPRIRVNFYS